MIFRHFCQFAATESLNDIYFLLNLRHEDIDNRRQRSRKNKLKDGAERYIRRDNDSKRPATHSGASPQRRCGCRLARHEFRLVTTRWPEGLLWLSKIKDSQSAPAVVLITAFGDVPLAVEAMKGGAEDFITKPWDNEDLIDKLLRAIKRNRISKKREEVLANASSIMEKDNQRRLLNLDEVKYEHACEIVDACGGNFSAAAKRLGINRQTLYNILKKNQ